MTEYIELGGKKRPIKFSYKAIFELRNELKPEHDEADQIEIATLAALRAGARGEKQPFDHSREDVAIWLEDSLESFIQVTAMMEKATEAFNKLGNDPMPGKQVKTKVQKKK